MAFRFIPFETQMPDSGESSSICAPAGQAEIAAALTRGVCRYARNCGWSPITEFILPNGRRADVMALAKDGTLRIIEIKSCVSDLRSDRKWEEYLDYCDKFYFCIGSNVNPEFIPRYSGLIIADPYDAHLARESPDRRLGSSTRRSLLIRFGQCAANRIQDRNPTRGR